MKLFGKIIKIIAVLLVVVCLYFMTLHYRREPFSMATSALEYFIRTENRLPSDVNEMLVLYNKEFTPLTVKDVRMINWNVNWDRLVKKDSRLFNEKGEKVDIIYPRAIDPILIWDARNSSVYLFDIYQGIKMKPVELIDKQE